ncbi:MAG: twin-arginine translocation signal domain-containing protein [Candidatus Latescibacterota bacterium]
MDEKRPNKIDFDNKRNNECISRRGFIQKTSATALAGAAGISGLDCSAAGVKSEGQKKKIKQVKLGRTGLKVSQFLGDRMADRKMYELALDAGVNYWHKFGQWVEPAPYDLFQKMDRDAFYCDTTVHTLEKDKALEIFESMLKKTGLSMIDGFKVHSVYEKPEDVQNKKGVIQAFEILKKQGKTRFLMLSQHNNVAPVFEAAIDSDMFDLIQVPVNPLVPRADAFSYKGERPQKAQQDEFFRLIKKAKDKNIAVTAMKVFLYGTKNWENVPDLKEKVSKYLPDDKSIARALIHYSLSIPGVVAYGSMLYNFEELKENIEAVGGKLTLAEEKGIQKFADAMSPEYCRMCGACERANPDGVAVSSILRFKGYHTGFGDPQQARSLYAALPAHARVESADDLAPYEKVCPYGLPVASLLKKAKSMLC